MKEINGTITLAYVEEDNRQRVIFRVIPLCTREGSIFHGGAEEFPDEGSLRIVPDKREQSTFKERMREIGGLCVVQLTSDGKELMKVRQNRNYAPDQGEKNQFAIYSDVICEFVEDGCLEVIESAAGAASAITAKVLFMKDKILYGPVSKQEAMTVSPDSLKPFGNDCYLLHTVEAEQVGRHMICWNPEATLNWRQRRNTLRRKERGTAEEQEGKNPVKAEEKTRKEKTEPAEKAEKAEKPDKVKNDSHVRRAQEKEEKIQTSEKPEKNAKPEKRKPEKTAAKAEEKPADNAVEKPAEKESEELPIGTHLEILDAEMPFEQQISRLAQPLSESANRLTSDLETPEEEPVETVAHFSGTPISREGAKAIKVKTKAESVHAIVEQQIMGQRDEVMGSELGGAAHQMVLNPIENLRAGMEYVWQNAEMREQALEMLMHNEAFVADLAAALRKGGMNLQATAAAQEQLAEIEADRLRLLMELDFAKENNRKFREEAVASASQKKRDEVERLKNEVRQLEQTRKKLTEASKVLSSENAQQISAFMNEHMTCKTGIDQQKVFLSPVLGHEYTQKELAEQLRLHMNESGFSISEDDAMSILISFAICDALCLRGRTVQDAQLFAEVLLESFGLQSVSAAVHADGNVEMISLLAENADRTPTVTMQPAGTEAITVFGHKTLYLMDENAIADSEALMPFAVVRVPAMMKRSFGRAVEWKPLEPASLSSFAGLRSDSHPMLTEAEKWFGELKRALAAENVVIPDAMYASMRRFIEVATRKIRGGFLAAADLAVCSWIVPVLLAQKPDEMEKIMTALAGLPRTMEYLGVH